ncbi:MAG: MBL fold metallo-hydrolase [Chloroflexi bacterium]|nr:MAG: MBL fold metallo-hydrolase [Chloroflexota bacterium]TMF47623.1 MAG: MBL fold metallo-hydrolase [Chloroflexota bacterium]TMG18311.1 MAG: MBL fold metallo-hydrolase [Chloroflexota bacterium]TMG50450.1 MAG: MBL fold metallo-hydrolase [Chloroflexota bacterium]
MDVSIFADELFGENCFLIRRRDTAAALVVDPGLQLDRVVRQLREERLTVERILVTHGHIDHVGGVPALHQDTGAPIAMHPDDLAILDWDQLGRLPFIPRGFGPFSIDLGLTHGMTLSFADLSVRVLHTPGHTEGSVCFLFGLDCFAGDTLFQRGIGRTDLPGGDMRKIVFSIRDVLYALPPKTVVYPGHGPRTTIEEEMLLNPFVPAG